MNIIKVITCQIPPCINYGHIWGLHYSLLVYIYNIYLFRHCSTVYYDNMTWQRFRNSTHWGGNSPVTKGIPSQELIIWSFIFFFCRYLEHAVEETITLSIISQHFSCDNGKFHLINRVRFTKTFTHCSVSITSANDTHHHMKWSF